MTKGEEIFSSEHTSFVLNSNKVDNKGHFMEINKTREIMVYIRQHPGQINYSIHWWKYFYTFLNYWWNDILKVTPIIYQKSKVVLKAIVWAIWVVILIGKKNLDTPRKEILRVTVETLPSSLIFFATELVFFVQIISSACE